MPWWQVALELVSPVVLFFVGGRWVGRVETVAKRLEESMRHVEEIPVIATRVGTLEQTTTRMLSEHRELARKVDDTRDRAVRAELASQHDG